jgi:hypothetical protein
MLFELIERAKEMLTKRNTNPQSSCSVCLCELNDDDECPEEVLAKSIGLSSSSSSSSVVSQTWLRTECFHFFHVDCLASWYDMCRMRYFDRRREAQVSVNN